MAKMPDINRKEQAGFDSRQYFTQRFMQSFDRIEEAIAMGNPLQVKQRIKETYYKMPFMRGLEKYEEEQQKYKDKMEKLEKHCEDLLQQSTTTMQSMTRTINTESYKMSKLRKCRNLIHDLMLLLYDVAWDYGLLLPKKEVSDPGKALLEDSGF